MGYTLRDDLHFCVNGSNIHFLDLRNMRYSALLEPAQAAFLQLVKRQALLEPHQQAIDLLLRKGVLVQSSSDQVPSPCRLDSQAITSILDQPTPQFRTKDVLIALWRFLKARRQISRGMTQKALLAIQSQRRSRSTRKGYQDRLTAIAAAYRWSGLLTGVHDLCLPRSIAMAEQCASDGVPADLVIGIRPDPFLAHCWVQHKGLVLNDDIDNVRTFTPILVI